MDKSFCGCWTRKQGALIAGQITAIFSAISCAIAFSVFFRSTGNDDGHSKLTAFWVACYSIIYIAISRSFVRAVKDDIPSKFVVWMVMSIVTIVFLLCGSVFVIYKHKFGRMEESVLSSQTALGCAMFCLLFVLVMVYWLWEVFTLKKYMQENPEVLVQ